MMKERFVLIFLYINNFFFFWILKVVSFIQTEAKLFDHWKHFFLFYVYDTILSISFDGALTDQVTSNALKTSSSEKS